MVEGRDAIGIYRFPSLLEQVEGAFSNLQESPGFPENIDLETYVKKLRPEKRREIYDQVMAAARARASSGGRSDNSDLSKISADFVSIELAVRSQFKAKLENKMMELIDLALNKKLNLKGLSAVDSQKIAIEISRNTDSLQKINLRLTPYFMPKANYYGIPLTQELPSDAEVISLLMQYLELSKGLYSLLEDFKGKAFEELRETSNNIQKFMADLNPSAEIVHIVQLKTNR